MKQNDIFEKNNNRGNKTKTIRRGYFMKYFLNFLFVINGIFGSVSAQQYPVRLVPVVFPPYNVRLSDYALNSEPKLQLQVLMTDLLEPPHKTGIKFSLESGGRVIAVSSPFVNGLDPFMLQPGNNISLSNLDLKPLFKLENLSGISPANYAKALPDGLYQYCFQAYDFYTKNNLSQKSCASVYQVLYEPPFLNLPQKGEKVTKKAEFQGVVFNWSPRQVAPNTKYIFTLKEIWDKQRDPVSAFLAARVLWKEETFAPSLYYGVDKTQLIPGRRYAWQVQAVSGTPQYNHSPIQEGGVYKNNGLSEIFFFDYVENCPVPAFLMAKTTARGRAEIQWMLQGASSKLFRVEYRKKGSSSPWLSETSYQTSAILSGLENNTEYEYRVGAVCGENKSFDPNDLSQADAFAYSGVQYFTTNFSNQNKNSAQCGVMPHVDLANKKPYDRQLTPNEIFTAGDFPVTVITAQGNAGNYTGEGFIQVPYLADTKIKVKFNNIQLNSDKQLINGTVETAYDANESAVHYASAGLGEIFGDKGIKDIKINYKIEKITLVMTPAPGVLRIVGIDPNGENKGPVQELPAGRDYTITDSNGKIWQVDEQGTVTEGEEIAKSGKSNADNTEGVKTSASGNISEITQYSANGVAIKWISMKNSRFYFDTPDITGIPFDRYPQVKDTKGRNIVIPYKAVVKGQKEFIGARIIIEDPKLKEAKIEFKVLGSGKLINAELISNTGNQREYKLELKGVFSYGEEEIMAVLLPSENQQKTNKEDKKQKELKEAKQKIIGSFRLVHLEPKNVNLSLVPLDKASEAELDTIAKNIHNTYSRAGINFDIKKQPVLDISAITTKDIETPDDNPLSHYSKMQQSINRLYPAKINEYVLFITEKASSTGQKGFMPLGGQYGYAYKSKDKNTPAHELGHGVFRLEHPWSNKLIKTPRASTNLLMDYAGAAELSHFDWKQINDPKIKIYTFQKQEEGELAGGYGLTPNWQLVKTDTNLVGWDTKSIPDGFVPGFYNDKKHYEWKNGKYFNGENEISNSNIVDVNSVNDKATIWLFYNTNKSCNYHYYIRTPLKNIRNIILNKNHNALLDFISKHKNDTDTSKDTYSGYLGCPKNNTYNEEKIDEQTNNGVSNYSGKKIDIQPILDQLNISNKNTGIKGRIFITDSSTSPERIKEIQNLFNDLEKSSKKEIYLWANYVDEKQFTIDFTVGGGVENRENIIKNRAVFKKIPFDVLSWWKGKLNPMSAIFDGLAHLISYLEIPPKFYDPTVEEYNPILYEVDKAISQFTPSDIIAKEVIKKSGIKTEKNVTPEHLTFAFKVGLWNGLVENVKGIPELASLQYKGMQFLYDKEFRKELIDKFDEWIEKCNKYNDSDTYVGCAWDMLWEHIKQAHTTGSSPKIAQQYGKSTFDLITIPLGMVKAGKLGKINKIMDLLDPISNTMKIAGKTVKVTFNTTRRTFKYVINTAGKNFKRYELRFKIDGNTLYCGIPNGKISIIDKLKQADIEKLPVDENGIRIADIDGEAIPIGNKNALEKIGEAVENTLEQLKKLGWKVDDINLFNNTFKGAQTLENAKSWKLLKDAGRTQLMKNADVLETLTRIRANKNLKKIGATDELLAKIQGVEGVSYEQVLNNLDLFANNMAKNNVTLNDFNKVLNQLTQEVSKRDGANWIVEYLAKNSDQFKGRKLIFEEFNSTTLGGRFIDVTDETITSSKVFYEFKSVKTVPPKDFVEQFMKDLSNADNLSQIKWIFNGRKNPVDFKKNMLDAIDGLLNTKDINKIQHLEKIAEKMTGFKNINMLRKKIKENFELTFELK